ncbi:CRISPR-associated endonuclease Cas2 [Aneurinibacillus uraniidurans]|uniref:CRISPR-associated endonuclease Cas2 n=1 Tax=Aneurinibacillus uraniidurans TaxID=2966586 RepID=UPI00234B237D|nr:CRISPR-associated endonuclease Cas2 [Aneurinibacillus sp. B1]WCN36617.1 CRISPR-associated endonuclease Cas2 [Aneurinibacillus sp. B1]
MAEKKLNYNYIFLFYDVNELRVHKVFKICKKYLFHHQNSVFRGPITPSNIIKLRKELATIVQPKEDFVSIIKVINEYSFEEETLGQKKKDGENLFL